MASYYTSLRSDDENAPVGTHTKPTTQLQPECNDRPILGHLSPNTKIIAPKHELLKRRPMISSPLKRGFSAEVDEGQGFTYFKKRKCSGEITLGAGASPVLQAGESELLRPSYTDDSAGPLRHDEDDGTTPTEPNTPSDSGHPQSSEPSSAERASFSSLINYDISSQQQSASQQKPLLTSITCMAEVLRVRLQAAMYKVRTNQVSKTFDDLLVPADDKPKSRQDLIEEAVAALRREAQLTQPLHDRPAPKLQFGYPTLQPTAYSSRMLYNPALHSSTLSVNFSHQQNRLHTASCNLDKDLTSSVVKDCAAERLLDLRNTL